MSYKEPKIVVVPEKKEEPLCIKLRDCDGGDVVRADSGACGLVISMAYARGLGSDYVDDEKSIVMLSGSCSEEDGPYISKDYCRDMIAGKGNGRIVKNLGPITKIESAGK